jgi:hypothetical protein
MLKRLIGFSGLLCGMLLASGALARPHPQPMKEQFDKVGRPDIQSASTTRDTPKTYQRNAKPNAAQPTAPQPTCLDQRRQRGELWDSSGRATDTRTHSTQPTTGQKPVQAGKSPTEHKAEQRANCSEFQNCSAPAASRPTSSATSPWWRREHPRAQNPVRPQVFDKGMTNVPYLQRETLVRFNILKAAFMPELGQSCRNGTDCWDP